MASVTAIRFFGFLLALLALLFLLIATPTHHWYRSKTVNNNNVTIERYGGIFEDCWTHSGAKEYSCITQNGSGYVKATKAFLVLAIVEFIIVIIYTFAFAFTRGICYKVLSLLLIVAGIFTMIAMSIYTDQHKVKGDDFGYGYSYGLGWTSFVFSIVGGVLLFFGGANYEKL